MKSICLTNVFFGGFPWYFDFFLKSCSTNATINFLIFTDQSTPTNAPSNVKFIPFSLERFNDLASFMLGMSINIEYAYKLCDFKPAYGVIFSEYLKEYEYWGITDIDIVFGRIREFITDEMLRNYEVISVRNDYPTGSFMIFENNSKVNNLFKKSKDYRKVFTSQKHYCFDECNSVHQYLENGGDIFQIETEIESMHHILVREMQENSLKVHFDFLIIEGLPGQLYWDNGFLSFKNEFEVLHYHLILYKDNKFAKKRRWKNIPNQFYIDRYLFRKKNIFSKIDYLLNERVRVWLLQKINQLDYFFAQKLFRNQLRNISQSLYFKEPQKRHIILNMDNTNNFSFSSEGDFFVAYKSFFKKDFFYLKNYSGICYHLSRDKMYLTEITRDGVSFKLEKE